MCLDFSFEIYFINRNVVFHFIKEESSFKTGHVDVILDWKQEELLRQVAQKSRQVVYACKVCREGNQEGDRKAEKHGQVPDRTAGQLSEFLRQLHYQRGKNLVQRAFLKESLLTQLSL